MRWRVSGGEGERGAGVTAGEGGVVGRVGGMTSGAGREVAGVGVAGEDQCGVLFIDQRVWQGGA